MIVLEQLTRYFGRITSDKNIPGECGESDFRLKPTCKENRQTFKLLQKLYSKQFDQCAHVRLNHHFLYYSNSKETIMAAFTTLRTLSFVFGKRITLEKRNNCSYLLMFAQYSTKPLLWCCK